MQFSRSNYSHNSNSEEAVVRTVIAGHFNEPDSYVTKRPQGRNDWLLTFTLGGEGYWLAGGKEQLCHTGDLTLLKPGAPHQYGTSKGQTWHFVWVHFPVKLAESNLLPEDEEELSVQHIDNEFTRERIHNAFIRILTDSRERGEYGYELCSSALREILLLLAQKKNRAIDSRVEETLHLLSQHMREQLKIDDIARKVGLSPSRLSHLFKSVTGQSIVDTLNQMRIQQAALLLEHTDRSASEVSHDVGFQNYNHFMNQFRKWYGVNPSTFRRKAL
ncbi:helix-turn-helix domain-containing protein [Paenibacillus agricola]|uniref:Helix-turn-helix domain-containing protein n=1 Tax=Paenibacillus agricola TaxID=2716264 RepID=A0ABX0J4B3_9BACL|nr:helix-turn-helix domain-containing protein [Paenibacillus agricola]NHN29682.1 helix-turn-helix domain-containing protein [Paenibacillus agricola]